MSRVTLANRLTIRESYVKLTPPALNRLTASPSLSEFSPLSPDK
jgi:hypothetical protein